MSDLHVEQGGSVSLKVSEDNPLKLGVGGDESIRLQVSDDARGSGLNYYEVDNEYGTTITIG